MSAKSVLKLIKPLHEPLSAEERLALAQAELKALRTHRLDERWVTEKLLQLKEGVAKAFVPTWPSTEQAIGTLGTPMLFASDWHWGEVVEAAQVNGVNEYHLGIAHRRARTLIQTTIHILKDCFAKPNYPGIVLVLGGDMVSGDIHDELVQTNELPMMPTLVDVYGVLVEAIRSLQAAFGRVAVVGVAGNHGRTTRKPHMKNRAFTNFDWLLYKFLEKAFEGEPAVTFLIPDGPDCLFEVQGHRYFLTHGDSFSGGDGIIGAIGPIVRGDHKTRSRANNTAQGYQTMLLGHWHQTIPIPNKVIVNGSLKGYDEYASRRVFGFEPPQQMLWLTHPKHGITHLTPIRVDR
jgi:hypothetical protein